MEAHRRVTELNGGQTKVQLTGRWFGMNEQEVAAEYQRRLAVTDSWTETINRTLQKVAAEIAGSSKPPV